MDEREKLDEMRLALDFERTSFSEAQAAAVRELDNKQNEIDKREQVL